MRTEIAMGDTAESRVRADSALGAIRIEAFRSGGPGGQHQNKTNSGIRVRAEITDTFLLNALKREYPGSVTDSGELISSSRSSRSQYANRVCAFKNLERKIKIARIPKKIRRKTKQSRARNEDRLKRKHRTGEKKKNRKKPRDW